jgi:adenosylcobinamide-GDP ribazoletransferase
MIKGLRGVFGFLTILPVGMDFEITDVAKSAWLFPIAGAVVAAIAAFVFYTFGYFFSDSIASVFALFALLALTGFHHLDGLLDFGDGLMRVGSAEKRREAMSDVNTGAGGFALGFFVLLATYLALTETTLVLTGLIVAEASAKFSMILAAFLGHEAHVGMGSAFTRHINTKRLLLTLAVYLLFIAAIPIEAGMLVFATAIASSLVITTISSKLFGGVSGDIFGAINEITRMLVLLVLLAWT